MTKEEIVAALLDDMEMPYLQDWQARDIVDFVLKKYTEGLPTIKGWVARDECLCFFQGEKPQLSKETKLWHTTEYDPIYLDESLLQDVQLENSPVEAELTIHRV